eukprot:jgi/Psemu1/43850/gm1.43850_g
MEKRPRDPGMAMAIDHSSPRKLLLSTKTYFEVKDDSKASMELFHNVTHGKPCTDGTAIDASARASKKCGYDDDSTARSECFQSVTETVSITSVVDEGILNTSITKNIYLESLLRAFGRPTDSTYMMGDEFGICVRPTQKYIDETYFVTGFKQVVCSNTDQTRTFFKNSVSDRLTPLLDISQAREKDGVAILGSSAAGFSEYFHL